MRATSLLKRVAAGAIVLAVTGAATLLTGGVASAQTNPIGTLSFSPPTSFDTTPPSVTTSGVCPAPSNAVHIRLQGPNGLDNLAAGRTTAGFSNTDPITLPFTTSFRDTANNDTPPAPIVAGVYTVSMNCVSGLSGTTVVASFVSQVTFTTPTTYTTSTGPSTIATTTSLGVNPPSPVTAGTSSTLTATVSPSAATGTVQFFNGATSIGTSPVSGGTATASATLPTGSNSLTAVFTAANTSYGNSTSPAVTYQVNPAPGAVTTTALSVTPAGPANAGAPVTLNAAVSSGAGTPTGTVQFSDRGTPLGAPVTLTGGAASFTTSTLSVGNHALQASFVSATPATFANSASATVSYDVVGLVAPALQDITTTVNAGALTITVATRQVILPSPTLDPDASKLTTGGRINPVTVSDTRAGNPGWTASGQVSDFSNGATPPRTINGGNLGWTPNVVSSQSPVQTVTAGPVVNPALAIAPGATPAAGLGLATARTLATAAPGFGTGTAVLDALLALNVPTSTTAGTYTALLTLTAI